MPGEGGEGVRYKEPKELQADVRNVNLHSALRYRRPFQPPERAITDPRGALEEIRELRRQGSDTLRKSQYDRYGEYVEMLREMRQKQREAKVEGVGWTDSSQSSDSESIGLSAHLAREVVDTFNELLLYEEDPVFTPEDIAQAMQNEREFFHVLRDKLSRSPDLLYKAPAAMMQLLPEEEIKQLIEDASSYADGFILSARFFKPLLTREEIRKYIDANLAVKHSPDIVLLDFMLPEMRDLYEPSEMKAIIIKELKSRDCNGMSMDYYVEKEIITREEAKEVILDKIRNFSFIKVDSSLLPSPDDDVIEIKTAIQQAWREKGTVDDYTMLAEAASLFTPDEFADMVGSLIAKDPVASSEVLKRTPFLEGHWLTPEQSTQVLRKILSIPDFAIDVTGVNALLKSEGLPIDEKQQFITQLIESDQCDILYYSYSQELWITLFEEGEQRDRIARLYLSKLSGHEKIQAMRSWIGKIDSRIFTEWMLNTNITQAAERIFYLHDFGSMMDDTELFSFLERYKEPHADALLGSIFTLHRLLPEGHRDAFIRELIYANPAEALSRGSAYYGEEDEWTFSQEEILNIAKSDTDRLSFAPKILGEFLEKFQLDIPPERQRTLLHEAKLTYKQIGFIKTLGLVDDFRRIQPEKGFSLGEERKLLETFYGFALLKDNHPDLEIFTHPNSLGNTLEEAQSILFDQLTHLIGVEHPLTLEERTRFFDTLQTPIPFMLYLLQYEGSSEHRAVLKDIFTSITSGTFKEWKFGAMTEEGLALLQQSQLLPEGLSLEQYRLWSNDGETTLFESLATDTKVTADKISLYLQGNINHLQIEEQLERLRAKYPDHDLLNSIKQELRDCGKALAETNRELSLLIRSSSDTGRLLVLTEQKRTLEHEREELVRTRKIFRLINITANEVASGYFLEKDGQQRTEPISKVVQELLQSADAGDKFVFDEIQQMLTVAGTVSSEKQNLVCIDSSDPKVWLEIGEQPVASCQSYNQGVENSGLLGYTDPNTKILIVRNEKGNIIGRSIFRLLTTSTGEPALHVERVYSSYTGKGVLRSLFARASEKAKKMGLPLLISDQSQTAEGPIEDFELAEGYQADPVDYELVSNASRAPYVYVDSAGGLEEKGEYRMDGLLQVTRKFV